MLMHGLANVKQKRVSVLFQLRVFHSVLRFIAEKVWGFTVARQIRIRILKNVIGNNLNMNSRYRK